MKQVHPTETYPCSDCDYVATTKLSYKLHFNAIHTEKKYDCDKCGKGFEHPFSLRKHVNYKHKGYLFSC